MRNTLLLTMGLAATAMLAACSKSSDVSCQPGYGMCGGSCVRLAADAANCGACGRVCAVSEACVSGACVPDCRASLHAPIEDPWGTVWDGLERPLAKWTTARDACDAIGGRLPTASEVYRAGVKTAAVGDTYQTSLLWTIVPYNASNAWLVRLSDGTFTWQDSTVASAATNHFRCVCPPPRPAAFTGSACFTSKLESGCVPLAGDPRFNFDAEDRFPSMNRSGAMFECALAGGELPSSERLISAFGAGLGGKSGAALHTADDSASGGYDVSYQPSDTVPFGAAFAAQAPGATLPFRCFGPVVAGVPADVSGFREPRGERTIDADPDHAATTFTRAIADCFARGGHLPTGAELQELVIQGLPAGAVAGQRWTAEQTIPTQVESFGWTGAAYWPVDADLATTTVTASGVTIDAASAGRIDKATGVLPYRCVYYGVDPGFVPPTLDQCHTGGCSPVISVGRGKMWFQSNAHGASTETIADAIRYCAARGGRLPSVRDLVEAARAGLNGTGVGLLTSDIVDGGWRVLAAWSGPFPEYSDSGVEVIGFTGATAQLGTRTYRCMWTNEVR